MIALAPSPRLAPTATIPNDLTQASRENARWLFIRRCLDAGWHVGLMHSVKPDGSCTCGKPDCGRDVGKHPLSERGPDGEYHEIKATDNGKVLSGLFAKYPWANIGLAPGPSGLFVIDVDTERGATEAAAKHLPPTIIRHSRMPAYLYRRPDGCPLCREDHAGDSAGFDLLTSGWLVIDGKHQKGHEVYLAGDTLEDAPAWAVEMLIDAAPKGSPTTTERGPIDVERERPIAEQALALLDDWRADEYGAWIGAGMSLSQLGDVGLELWEEFSKRSPKYKPGECARKWRTFDPNKPGGKTLGSLYFWAEQDSGTNPAKGGLVFSSSAETVKALRSGDGDTEQDALIADLRAIIRRQASELLSLRQKVQELLALQAQPAKHERDSVLALHAEYEYAKSRRQLDCDDFARVSLGAVAENAGFSRPTVSAHGRMFAEQTNLCEIKSDDDGIRIVDRETGEVVRTLPAFYVKFNGTASEIRQAIAKWEPERPKRGRPVGRYCPKHPDADLLLAKVWRCTVCHETVDIEETTVKALRSDDAETTREIAEYQGGGSTTGKVGTSEVEPDALKVVSHPCAYSDCGAATENPPAWDHRHYCDAHKLVPDGRIPPKHRYEDAPPPTFEDYAREFGDAAAGGA